MAQKPIQMDHLKNVLRLKVNDSFRIFNGTNGEFIATIKEIMKHSLFIDINNLIRKPEIIQNLTLGICIIKMDRINTQRKSRYYYRL